MQPQVDMIGLKDDKEASMQPEVDEMALEDSKQASMQPSESLRIGSRWLESVIPDSAAPEEPEGVFEPFQS